MSDEEFVDLDTYFTCWRGYLIRSGFDEMIAGLRQETERLEGKRFLVTQFRQEYDIDGLTEYLDSIEGFNDQSQAREYTLGELDRLSKSDSGSNWGITETDTIHGISNIRKPSAGIKRVFYRGFKMSDGSGFNSLYRHFEVLEVSANPVVGEALFKYLNCQQEFINYFRDIGRNAR